MVRLKVNEVCSMTSVFPRKNLVIRMVLWTSTWNVIPPLLLSFIEVFETKSMNIFSRDPVIAMQGTVK